MKRRTLIIITGSVIVGAVAYGVFLIADHYLAAHAQKDVCSNQNTVHAVTIADGRLSATDIEARRCDTFTITNKDTVLREVAFGVHDHHQAYNGTTEKLLKKGESMTVTLDRTGTFTFHDHLHDELQGHLIVTD